MEAIHPVRQWRKKSGVTLACLAQKTRVTASHLSEIERGLDRPSLDLSKRLSAATANESGEPAVSVQEIADATPVKSDAA